MKKKIFSSVFFLLACGFIYGQGEMDALRYSSRDLTGTARSMGMGGAFGALGADVTGVAINPAGIGVYRSSEIVSTMNFSSAVTSTNAKGSVMENNKFEFNFDNLAIMGYVPLGGSVKSFNYGFSYNRLKNFDRNYSYNSGGYNQDASFTDYLADYTTRLNANPNALSAYGNHDTHGSYNGYSYDDGYFPWISILGYDGGLINYNGVNSQGLHEYGSPLHVGERVNPSLSVSERGYINSYDFTGGINIEDKLYLGMTYSLADLSYSMSSRYTEEFEDGGGYDLDNYLDTEGSGHQFSLGAIYSPINALRLGVAYHSPTWYRMSDFYSAETATSGIGNWNEPTPRGVTDYQFSTPYRWVFSAAGFIGTKAIVSIDYELSDYSGMHLKDPNGFQFGWDPEGPIRQDFKVASTVKAGIEYKITPQTSIRGGYAWIQSPLETSFQSGAWEVQTVGTIPHFSMDGDIHYVTLGLGCRITRNFYIDAAFVYSTQTNDLYGFSPSFQDPQAGINTRYNVDPVEMKVDNFKGVLTFGYKFNIDD